MVTVLGSFAKSSYPLLRANKVNIKSSCVLDQTDARDQVEAAGLSSAAHTVPGTNMLFKAWTRHYRFCTNQELKLFIHLGDCLLNKLGFPRF